MKRHCHNLLLILLLTGCSKIGIINKIQEKYPLCEVREIPGRSYTYVMRDECGSVWYVECDYTGCLKEVELIK